jgi:uncharacterized membrane protein YfcA
MARDRDRARAPDRRAIAEAEAAAFYKQGRAWWFRALMLVPFVVLGAFLAPGIAFFLGVAVVVLFFVGLRIAVRGTVLLRDTPEV